MNRFDAVVIGGGPAGMLAAGEAARTGKRVLLLEKNDFLGRKLLITGKGRCNLTQAEYDVKTLIQAYRANGKFLFTAFNLFGPSAVADFFTAFGLSVKIERGGRVFPASDTAVDVIKTLKKYLVDRHVTIWLKTTVRDLLIEAGAVRAVCLLDGRRIDADQVVVATGGLSYPATGCTGDGYQWACNVGHTIMPTTPALVPLAIAAPWVKELQGLSLKNVALTAWQNNKKIAERFGEMLFTHLGVSGPIVLDLSREVVLALARGPVELSLNFKPVLNQQQLDQRLQRDFKNYRKKFFKNYLAELLPQKLINFFVRFLNIDPSKPVGEITRVERQKIVAFLTDWRFTISNHLGYDTAIITAGGVATTEIDPRTLRSKIIKNLYFVGEILDVDGPTGGYNLQAAWATGYLAGRTIADLT